MVGIVIVSHSFGVGRELIKFCQELKNYDFPLINASGLEENILGTNPLEISKAIEAADQGDGVIVLCDLGSAVMSSEMALELLEGEHKVTIADAPLVEGAIIGSTSNSPNLSLKELYEEILEAKTTPKF